MNISSINNLSQLNKLGLNSTSTTASTQSKTSAFENIFEAAKNLVSETNNYSQAAQEAETAYSLGLVDSPHELQVAQQKANLSLQYTVAIRNNVMEAYKEIMNLQF